MRKSILVVDWLLVMIFTLMIASKFINPSSTKVIQPIFFVLITIHVIQHWKVIAHSFKGLRKR